jgi:competence protein ComEC
LVITQPILSTSRTSFVFRAKGLESGSLKYNCCGDILVYVRGNINLHYGEELILTGNLYRPFRRIDNNQQGYRRYLYDQGIFHIAYVKSDYFVKRVNKNRGWFLRRFALGLKDKTAKIIFRQLNYISASVLEAMILGEKRHIPHAIYNSMIKSGTVHILVVSGFNVGIVTFIVILFLKLIRLPRLARFYAAVPILIIYCLMTGASTPVVRATLMAVVFMCAYFVKREPDIYHSCAIAAIAILLSNPLQLFDIGFQLSFSSVIAIAYFYPRIKSLLHLEDVKIKVVRFFTEGCLVSFSAWLGTMGFIAYYFKIFSPLTVLANLFIVPLATLITLCGFSLIVISLIYPPIAPLFSYSCEFFLNILLTTNASLIRIPGAYFHLHL